jgi:hypothetical protein
MPTLTREQILNAKDGQQEEVDMRPFKWPGSVFIRSMTGVERGKFEASMQEQASFPRFRALLLAYCMVDDKGNQLFNDAEDVDALNTKNAAALDYLYDKAQTLCGWRKKDIDELTKNSSAGQSEGSITA